MAVKIDASRCPQNHPCPAVNVCPVDALTQEGYCAPKVDKEKCVDCGQCIRYCPGRAFSL